MQHENIGARARMGALSHCLRRLHPRRRQDRLRTPYRRWRRCLTQSPLLWPLGPVERARLRRLSGDFLARKTFTGAGGMQLDDSMRLHIATHACLLILRLDLDYYAGFHEIIVYPETFMVDYEEEDEFGLVHRVRRPLSGEAWEQGPVILAWRDIAPSGCPHDPGASVILHEFAHKLDMRNGAANGMPPPHPEMTREDWTRALTAAYHALHASLEDGEPGAIDPYAAEDPAEFFAVLTEVFFAAPERLRAHYPAVHEQFRRFYRQDPGARHPAAPQRPCGPGLDSEWRCPDCG